MTNLELMVTLWPSFPHFPRFSRDSRLSGIRLNSAMMSNPELEQELALAKTLAATIPLWYDIKGRQLRVEAVHENPDNLDITLNHAVSVETPTIVLFKAACDHAVLDKVTEAGRRLIFQGGPYYEVKPGESLHIRHPSLRVHGQTFTDYELAKIEKTKKAGFTRYFLSYVESQRDVDQFLELVGKDVMIQLKIENKKGLDYVARKFKKQPNIFLVAARGDLYVEVDRPHEIIPALKLIIAKDPEACVGSRILLSIVQPDLAEVKRAIRHIGQNHLDEAETEGIISYLTQPQLPSCADFCELAWLYDIGYRNMLLCDELCLKENLMATAVNAFESFRIMYDRRPFKEK